MKKLILIPILFLSYFMQAQYIVVKPSQLPAASTINLTDLFILNQGTTTKKVTYIILNTILKDTFLTKKVTLDSIAALRGDIGTGSSQWTTTPNGISYSGAIFPGSIKKPDAVADTFISIPILASGKFGFMIKTNTGYQNYINTNNAAQNNIDVNNAYQNYIGTNQLNQNYIGTNNGYQNYISTNAVNRFQNYIFTNNGIGSLILENTGTGLNFSGTGKHIRMTSTGTDTTEVFNQTSTGLNQVFRKNGATTWKVDGNGTLTTTGSLIINTDTLATRDLARKETFIIALSGEKTNLAVDTLVGHIYAPYPFQIVDIFVSTIEAPTGATVIYDIKKNFTSIFSTKISIDASEKTSLTAATAYVLTGTTTFAKGDYLSIRCDQIGSTLTGKGGQIVINVKRLGL